MAVSERDRLDFFERLGHVIGPNHAATLMAMIDELVTKDYLNLRLNALEDMLTATIHREIAALTRIMVFALLTAVVTVASLAFAAASLAQQ